MFVRYEIASTNTTSALWPAVITDINGIFNGTITSTAGFTANAYNSSLSTFTGTINSTLYSAGSIYVSTGTGYSASLIISKFHSVKTSGYTPASKMGFTLNAYATGNNTCTATFRFNQSNATNTTTTNTWPSSDKLTYQGTSNPQAFFDNTNTNYVNSTFPSGSNNMYSCIARILIWANDSNCVVHVIYTDGTMATGGLFDYEPGPSDQYAYNLNNQVTPQIYMCSMWRYMTGASNPQSGVNGIAFGRGIYLQNNNTISAAMTPWSISNLDIHYGNQGNTNTGIIPTIYPLPRFSQYSAGLASGSTHNITPVYYMPGINSGVTSSPCFGKLPNFYRTTDDIADSGEIITDANSVQYAVLRLHKTKGYGAADYVNQTPNACYLIPV